MPKTYCVYILACESGVLYTGGTNDLERRVLEHKQKLIPGFTRKYNVTKLVWFEAYARPISAIAREKEIKAWRRSKKVALIEEKNPLWNDLLHSPLRHSERSLRSEESLFRHSVGPCGLSRLSPVRHSERSPRSEESLLSSDPLRCVRHSERGHFRHFERSPAGGKPFPGPS